MVVYTYRYVWKTSKSDSLSFKIVSDVSEGLTQFESSLLALPDLITCVKEYLHEYDCSKVGYCEKIFNSEENK